MTVKRNSKAKPIDLRGAAVKATSALASILDVVGRVTKAAGGTAHAFDQTSLGRLANGVGQDLCNAGASLNMAKLLISGEVVDASPENGPPGSVVDAEFTEDKPKRKPRKQKVEN